MEHKPTAAIHSTMLIMICKIALTPKADNCLTQM